MTNVRLAVVVSHPIQHFCPQYASWSDLAGVDVNVLFASRHGLDPYEDKGFGQLVRWDLVLDFSHEFLPGAEDQAISPGTDSPLLETRLCEFEPDVVLVYGYSQALQRRAIRWATAAKLPILMMADSELRQNRHWLKRSVKAILLPRILDKVDRFLTVGDANEAYYRRYGVSDKRMIRSCFPIDTKVFDQVLQRHSDARTRVRHVYEIPHGHKVLLMVGKMVPSKRQIDLVGFSNSIQSSRDDVTVLLAGTGPDERDLRSYAKRHGPGGVVFAGFIPPRELAEYYGASDIYVHTSEVDAHSVAISEAIYCGLPVVLSDRCGSYGPTDDVRVGLNGYVYECANAPALSSALLRLIESDERRQSMGAVSSEIAQYNQRLAHGRALVQAFDDIGL